MTDILGTAKAILGAVAPHLGAALGGPFGGIAARAITEALGIAPSDDPAQAARGVAAASPADLLAVKRAEQAFRIEMERLGLRAEEIAAADRASARSRQARTRDPMPALIALAALAGFFGILTAMVLVDIPAGAMQPLLVMLGALGTLVTQIGAFYFGSSAGSARKTESLERLAAGVSG